MFVCVCVHMCARVLKAQPIGLIQPIQSQLQKTKRNQKQGHVDAFIGCVSVMTLVEDQSGR